MKLLFPMALPSWKENGTRWCWPPGGCVGTQPRCHPLRPQAWLRLPGAGRKDHVSLRSRCLLNSSCQKNSKCFCFPPPKKKQPLEEEEPEHQRVSSLHWPDLSRLSLSVCPSVLRRETLTEPLPSFKITSPGRARAARGGEHDPGEIILTQTPLLCLARQERFQARHIRHVIPIAIAPRWRQQQ